MKVEGSVFVVTGGASGLGQAVVRRAVELGAAGVGIFDLNDDDGEEMVVELGEDKALFAEVNVTDADSVQEGLAAVVEKFGRVDVVVNCAGIGSGTKTYSRKGGAHKLDYFKKVVEVNLVGTFNTLRLAAAIMAEQEPNADGERGVIVNTASVAAFDGQQGQASYSASKAGVVGMTLPIARDLGPYGIRICTICPGVFLTPMMRMLKAEVRASLEKDVPFPSRLGRPEEFALMATSIVENPYLNGETIRLDGALRMNKL
ncbi:hydroxyacyl dehydrogenase [Thecamonas trahens ATCC 50062]|uniref:3-hydroxyacyl-CoA dehydrogenase type-2 n=1 Tax=Thecamonas trahens ATCC 50062 TaxID=461836 RepID=A0A0L0D3P2_THETB|nr:hydroxyacyl dehydrogenase [Thecamonas trahens ATCC 50062]KNC46914.1 hydroxyacyl dehydrogenase [Thecamonas trahens ATCC 50062]|eukprot:XP_013760187.1 hydroxyacyl dehydrogenase [Thecamonas trahens ATCC 50062]